MTTKILNLRSVPETQPAKAIHDNKAGSKKVDLLAYNGGIVGPISGEYVAFDIRGLDIPKTVPLQADHRDDLSNLLGTVRANASGGRILASGTLVPGDGLPDRILQLAKSGHPLECSVTIKADWDSAEYISPNETVYVNGRSLSNEEGFTLIRSGELREISLVVSGADRETQVAIEAKRDSFNKDIKMNKEKERREKILQLKEDLFAGDDLAEEAIQKAWTPERFELLALRKNREIQLEVAAAREERRSKPVPSPYRRSEPERSSRLYEVSLARSLMGEPAAEKVFSADELERSKGVEPDLLQLARMRAFERGLPSPESRRDLLRMSSTLDIPNLLGDVQNKMAQAHYTMAPPSWRSLCKFVQTKDFKENSSVRAAWNGELEELGADGEIKHGSMSDEVITFQPERYAKMFSVDEKVIINDDLGVLAETSAALVNMAVRTASSHFARVLMDNSEDFWSASRGNFETGSTSALSISALSDAVADLRGQTDAEGNSLDMRPAFLVVSPPLESTARGVLESEFITSAAGDPTGNSMRRIAELVVEPRLSNTMKFDNASLTHWYLFSHPANMPMIFAHLGGELPFVETLPAGPDRYGYVYRVKYDYAFSKGDYRASVYSEGA